MLLEHCPDDTTQIFLDYYTGKFRSKKDTVIVSTVAEPQQNTNFAVSAVQNLASLLPLPYMSANANDRTSASEQNTLTRVVESTTEDEPAPQYEVPKPRVAFSAFVDHPKEFVKFLEACIKTDTLGEGDRVDVYTTLFEMYLRNANEVEGREKLQWEDKAKELVESKNVSVANEPSLHIGLTHFRSKLMLPTSCFYLTWRTFVTVPSLSANSKAYVWISSVHIPLQMIPQVRSRRCTNTGQTSPSSIPPRWLTFVRARKCWKKHAKSWTRFLGRLTKKA